MRYLQDVFGDKGNNPLSGTPISNSMVEMYSLLKYMRPNKMKELGLTLLTNGPQPLQVQQTR
jgi:N12 class adenine-specific DNA methylase